MAAHFCDCMRRTVLKTSWTESNPGRRFRACDSFGENGCGYFQWIDPPMCPRARDIMPGLLRRINRGEDELQRYKKRERKWVILVVFLVMLIFFLLFVKNTSGEEDGKVMEL